jgi:purine/pyrimidine-nucleoside phosphorylase
MISNNTYFNDNVKSLGYSTTKGKSTVGVMNPGTYEFNTGSAEVMTVIEGEMEVTLKGATTSKKYTKGMAFDVPANSSFVVVVTEQTSYLCQY